MSDAAERALKEADDALKRATRLLAVAVVAREVGVSPRTIRNWIADDRVAFTRTVGGHYRIPASQIARLVKIVGHIGKAGNAA